jgi:hypothetical protein
MLGDFDLYALTLPAPFPSRSSKERIENVHTMSVPLLGGKVGSECSNHRKNDPMIPVRKTDRHKTQYEERDVGEGDSLGDQDVKGSLTQFKA